MEFVVCATVKQLRCEAIAVLIVVRGHVCKSCCARTGWSSGRVEPKTFLHGRAGRGLEWVLYAHWVVESLA